MLCCSCLCAFVLVYPAGLSGRLRTLNLHAPGNLIDDYLQKVVAARFRDTRGILQAGCGLKSLLQQVLPQLTVLTRLQVAEVPDASIFQHAPPQLQELKAVGVYDPRYV